MASIISAGTTSGTSLNLSGDTSGVLQLATNGSTTAITVDTSQRVGIGTTTLNDTLTLYAASNTFQRWQASVTGTTSSDGFQIGIGSVGEAYVWQYENQPIIYATNNTERMRIDSSGRVTMPFQPAFCVNRTTTQSGSSPFIILFDNITTNIGSCYNASTGRFTAPIAGTYCFIFQNLGLISGWTYLDIFAYKNGSKDAGIISNRPTNTNGGDNAACLSTSSAIITLAANDYIDIRVTGTSIYSDANAWLKFMGYLIG